MEIKDAIKELDKNFGKDFSKKNPELVIKLIRAKSMENAGDKIAEALEGFATKMELSSIRGGTGGMGMSGMDSMGMGGLGSFGSMGSGMGKLGDMSDMGDFDLDHLEEEE